MPTRHIIWGSELSPFLLKLCALFDASRLRYRILPRDGSFVEGVRTQLLIQRAIRTRSVRRHPSSDPLDEYPLVPYVVDPEGVVHYDSSALAAWLDIAHPCRR